MNPQKNIKRSAIKQLLKSNQLPYDDIEVSNVELTLEEVKGEIVGCIGIERYGSIGLLRSLAVSTVYKNSGIGKKLVQGLIEKCKIEGIEQLHLLTTTADEYFKKFGFKINNKNQAPIEIAKTKEFSEICPASSVYMVLSIN